MKNSALISLATVTLASAIPLGQSGYGHGSHAGEIATYTTTAYAMPSATGSYRTKRDVAKALADCANAPSPDICTGVVNAIQGWDDSVNVVTGFLNSALSESGAGLTSDAQNALNFANKEPGFLGILSSTPNLDAAGQDAATTLGNVFGVIPQTLGELVAGTRSAADSVSTINQLRCTTVLGNISQLWISAAAAAGADTPGGALGPDVCPKPGGNVGDAFVNVN